MSEYITDKTGRCVCGKWLNMCEEECCEATLLALSGEWVKPWINKDGEVTGSWHHSDGLVWDWVLPTRDNHSRLWEMMIAVGGVDWFRQDCDDPECECGGGWWGCCNEKESTPEDAVINAYAKKVDWRTW